MISVCIATFNGEKYIKCQLSSILPQLSAEDEVVIADDGSTDKTLDIIRSFEDARIRIIDGAKRHSPIWNFEKALSQASGDYIYLSDQDDEWLPNKIGITQHYLQYYDCIVSDNICVNGDGTVISQSFYKINRTKSGKFYNLLVKNGYLGCCMAFKRNILEASLPFPPNIPMHDIWIGNVAAFKYNVKFIPEKLIRFCRHGDNASTTATKSEYRVWKRFKFRWNVLSDLLRLKTKV